MVRKTGGGQPPAGRPAGEASAPQAENNSGKVVGGQGNELVFA
jgi:hypothetical protein